MNQSSFFYAIEPFVRRLPAVERPSGHVHFKKKMIWTVGILIMYFALSNVPLFGLSSASVDLFGMYRAFFAGSFGTLMVLGIGPIVTASIVLQLMVGADLIKLDLGDPRDQAIFQGTQKLLVFVMIIVEALPQVTGGYLIPDLGVSQILGISLGMMSFILFLQICIGGVLILFMDEVVSKWGIGSGVGLFIVAGVSQQLITGIFNWTTGEGGLPIGIIPKWIYIVTHDILGIEDFFVPAGLERIMVDYGILALITTVVIILFVVFVESTRIEIPLAHSSVRGARGRFPVKLVYASVLPMILVRALQANVQMIGTLLSGKLGTITTAATADPVAGLKIVHTAYSSLLGTFISTARYDILTGDPVSTTAPQPISGLMYYLSPIHNPSDWIPSLVAQSNPAMELLGLNPIAGWQIWLHVFTDAFVLIVGGIIFAIFWIDTTGMGAKSVAKKIHASGLQVPGHRRNPASIEKMLGRYIPKVTVLGGAIIGLLTLVASLMGTLGGAGGTGLLLTVSIVYRLYEQIASEQIQEMYPLMRKFFGGTV
ncbi:MAG: preprotein translocase subunit SecY [Methanotrichaceae archaeon]